MRWIVGGKSGAEERGFAKSDGALRDAMARGAQKLRCSCRPVWPVDRPCARPKATPWHRDAGLPFRIILEQHAEHGNALGKFCSGTWPRETGLAGWGGKTRTRISVREPCI